MHNAIVHPPREGVGVGRTHLGAQTEENLTLFSRDQSIATQKNDECFNFKRLPV